MKKIALAALLGLSFAAQAAHYDIKMLNSNSEGSMVFEPGYLKVQPGDTVTFRAENKSHFVHSKAIQGIYDLPVSGNVNAALRYGFAKGKAILNLYCNDIFETGQISPRIRFRTQNVTNHYSCFRELGVSFTYKFGGYKEKQREGVDTSRFK